MTILLKAAVGGIFNFSRWHKRLSSLGALDCWFRALVPGRDGKRPATAESGRDVVRNVQFVEVDVNEILERDVSEPRPEIFSIV